MPSPSAITLPSYTDLIIQLTITSAAVDPAPVAAVDVSEAKEMTSSHHSRVQTGTNGGIGATHTPANTTNDPNSKTSAGSLGELFTSNKPAPRKAPTPENDSTRTDSKKTGSKLGDVLGTVKDKVMGGNPGQST